MIYSHAFINLALEKCKIYIQLYLIVLPDYNSVNDGPPKV